MNITLTGNLGSGKSSVCKELKLFGHEIISAGDIFRSIATEKGMTVTELNEYAKTDFSIDDMLDHRTMELDEQKSNAVFDSRLAWHFAKNSFKVFLLVEQDEAANRVFHGDARNAEIYKDIEETRQGLAKRAGLEQERYQQLYQINYFDPSNYDLIIESTNASPKEIATEIERSFLEYQKQAFRTRIELNLRSIYPTISLSGIDQEQLHTCQEREERLEGLCAEYPFPMISQNGYHLLPKDSKPAEEFAGALAAGKAFAVCSFSESVDFLEPLSVAEYREYERIGQFTYRTMPSDGESQTGYNIKL